MPVTILESAILGIIQGITEFLPISSSGHLIIFEQLFGLEVEKLLDYDITIHMGTLLAILIFFRTDIFSLLKFENKKMIGNLLIASLPAIIIGLFFKDQIEEIFRSTFSVSIFLIVVGALFFLPENIIVKQANQKSQTNKANENIPNLNLKNALIVGLAQSLALMPGVSRSGSTILTGTLLGLPRAEAARFSFLLGSIAIAGAGVLGLKDLGSLELSGEVLLTGFISSFISGILSIKFLMGFLKKYSLRAFGAYRIILGLALLLQMIV